MSSTMKTRTRDEEKPLEDFLRGATWHAERVVDIVAHYSRFPMREDLGKWNTVAEVKVDAELTMPLKTEYFENEDLYFVILEPTKVKVDRAVIESDDASGKVYTRIRFINGKNEVVRVEFPPASIEDVEIVVLNSEVIRRVAENFPDAVNHVEDILAVVNSDDKSSLISIGEKSLRAVIDEPVTAGDTLIVGIPVGGKIIRALWAYRSSNFVNALDEPVLDPYSHILLELNAGKDKLMIPIEVGVFANTYLSSLRVIVKEHEIEEELRRLPSAVNKKSKELLYAVGVLEALERVKKL